MDYVILAVCLLNLFLTIRGRSKVSTIRQSDITKSQRVSPVKL